MSGSRVGGRGVWKNRDGTREQRWQSLSSGAVIERARSTEKKGENLVVSDSHGKNHRDQPKNQGW